MHQEDTNHAFYCCPVLDSIWRQIPMWNHDARKGSKMFTDLIEFVFASNKDPELFSLVIWNLWNLRNNLRLSKAALPLDKILEHSRERQIKALASPATSSLHRSQQQASCLVMASLTQQLPLPTIVIEIEALAARRAMELALIGLDNIVLEGDNEILFKAMKNGDRNLA
nr:hypothetical protein CFP56_27190 [Quercus suber]